MPSTSFHLMPSMERDYCMSIAVRAGDLVFIGGLTAVDASGNELHHDDAALQFKVVYEQMSRVLAAHGGSAADVVSETIYYSCTGEEYAERLFPYRKEFYRDCDGPSVAGVQVAGRRNDPSVSALPGTVPTELSQPVFEGGRRGD